MEKKEEIIENEDDIREMSKFEFILTLILLLSLIPWGISTFVGGIMGLFGINTLTFLSICWGYLVFWISAASWICRYEIIKNLKNLKDLFILICECIWLGVKVWKKNF